MRTRAQLERVQKEGKLIRTAHLSVRVCASPFAFMRVGVVVPRYGHTAVERNRLKRHLREAVRLDLLPRGVPKDIVFLTREPAYRADYATLRATVAGLAEQLTKEQQ